MTITSSNRAAKTAGQYLLNLQLVSKAAHDASLPFMNTVQALFVGPGDTSAQRQRDAISGPHHLGLRRSGNQLLRLLRRQPYGRHRLARRHADGTLHRPNAVEPRVREHRQPVSVAINGSGTFQKGYSTTTKWSLDAIWIRHNIQWPVGNHNLARRCSFQH